MGDLAIRAVGDGGGGKERARLLGCNVWQETIEPVGEIASRQKPAHAFSLDQRWREEVVARGLAPGRAGGVGAEPALSRGAQQIEEAVVSDGLSIVGGEPQREGRVVVCADANRIGGKRQKVPEPLDDSRR